MNKTRSQIIEASIDLFSESGFWNTPTSKIVKHAKVSTGTLFNYFESKNGLIDEVFLQLQQEQVAYIEAEYPYKGTVKERVGHIWYRYIDWGVRYPARYRLLQQFKMSDLVSSDARERSWAIYDFASTLIPEAIETGIYRDVGVELIARFGFAQRDATTDYAITHGLANMALTNLIASSFEIYWAGMSK